jgi:phosphatidylserine/phosphatidylglycerophosphate/cardiolipin synthase-like enzyme
MIDAIRDLADADLRALASALRAGRLCPPYTATTLQRYCRPERTVDVAGRLQLLADEGMKAEHLALLLETAAALRSERAAAEDAVELVWTGPDLPGPCCRDTAVVVRELFGSAREEVLVAGYAVRQGKEVFRVLADRMDESPGLRVRMFLDVQRPHLDASPPSEILARFARRFRTQEWPGRRLPELFYDPRSLEAEGAKRASLHAKCVVIDRRTSFVSSANFTEAAQVRNVEVGTLVHSARFARQLAEHFDGLESSGRLSALGR